MLMKKKITTAKIKQVNILFTSIANKVSLVSSFRDAYRKLKISGKIIGVDMDRYSAAFWFCDKRYLTPPLVADNFLSTVLSICRRDKISLVIPTRDEDLFFFAAHRQEFERNKIRILVGSSKVIGVCRDKWKFYQYLKKSGIPVIKTWRQPPSDLVFPCIVKPRIGQAARGVFTINNNEEMKRNFSSDKIIQERIVGDEYTVDYFADFDARPISVIPRLRYRVSCGESKVAITKNDQAIINLCHKLGKVLKLIGHNTVQCFKLPTGEIKFLEINPRFGGGAALGIRAGGNTPLYILSLLTNQKVKPIKKFKENLTMIRFSQDIFLSHAEINRI